MKELFCRVQNAEEAEQPTELRSRVTTDIFEHGDCIFALATSPGRSAIAVFRCSGAGIFTKFSAVFSNASALEEAKGHQAVYGLLHWPKRPNDLVDEVLLLKFTGPRSFSGEDMVEIHSHGSPAVLRSIHELLLEQGLRQAVRGEFTYRSIRCGKRNILQAEAIAMLGRSESQNQRRIALNAMMGLKEHAGLKTNKNSFVEQVRTRRSSLLEVLAKTELQLDYDDSELDFCYEIPESFELAKAALEFVENALVASKLQQDLWRRRSLVLTGATNSGKSSLFNCLLQHERSIVSKQHGTTRDYVEARLELSGQELSLFDTAGLRLQSTDSIENEGMERSLELLEAADLIVYVCDVRLALKASANKPDKPDKLDRPELEAYQRQKRYIQKLSQEKNIPLLELWNKEDLLDASSRPSATPEGIQLCSALCGTGIAELVQAIQGYLPDFQELTVPASERSVQLLSEARALLCEYLAHQGDWHMDMASELLRQVCSRLGELTGDACNSMMLRDLFSNFCVGK